MDCSRLDRESHAVMMALQQGGLRKKTARPVGVRLYRSTATNVAEYLKVRERRVRDLLVDLDTHGWVTWFPDYGRIGEGEGSCTCSERRASVAPTTNPHQTRSARSGGEGGQGEESEGPKDPFAHDVREAKLRKKWELDRERREERLRGIEQKKPQDLNSNDLALLFWDRVKRYSPWASKVPGAVNHRAFGRCLAEWIRDGTPPELIREMIEVFAKDRKMLGDGDVAWKVFINRRALLAKRAANRVEFHAPDDLGWNDLPEDDDDDDLGWGAYLANDSEH